MLCCVNQQLLRLNGLWKENLVLSHAKCPLWNEYISAPKYPPSRSRLKKHILPGTCQLLDRGKKKIKVNCDFKALGVTHITSTQILLAKMIYVTSPDFKLQGCPILFRGGSSQITMTNSEIIGQGWKDYPSAERVTANYTANIDIDRVQQYNLSPRGAANVLNSNTISHIFGVSLVDRTIHAVNRQWYFGLLERYF